ncbi:MAG: DUF4292 domain-containing protein [Muribaculaceae bacterium]|nr:DUF4292 domain-containing protein [Muribaculaceae bacterium]
MNRLASLLVSLLLIIISSAGSPLHAQDDQLGRKEEKRLIERIADSYTDWQRASWSGKLSSDRLPVSVTMKVYMEKGKLTMISLRAPLFGEVARVEIDPDSLVVANKMKHTYYSRQLSEISAMAPDLTEDVQALLLGRMFAIGCGQLGKSCADAVAIFPLQADSSYMVVPDVPDYLPQVVYGFATDADLRISTFAAAYGRTEVASEPTPDNPDPGFSYEPEVQLQADITYSGKGAVARLEAIGRGQTYTATLSVGETEWDGKPFDRIDLSGYRRVAFRDVMRM